MGLCKIVGLHRQIRFVVLISYQESKEGELFSIAFHGMTNNLTYVLASFLLLLANDEVSGAPLLAHPL